MIQTLSSKEAPDLLAARLADARARTDEIFEIVSPNALYERSIPERHRIAFYLGHLEAFDGNLLRQAYDLASFNPAYDKLFAFGIDPVDGRPRATRPRSGRARSRSAPTTAESARRSTSASPAPARSARHDAATIVNMAIEHRLMHAETLAYLLHQLPYRMKRKREEPPAPPAGGGAVDRTIRIPAGQATLAARARRAASGWDNEFEERIVDVPEFTVDEHKVTNGRFLEFVESGGYQEPVPLDGREPGVEGEREAQAPDLLVEAGRGPEVARHVLRDEASRAGRGLREPRRGVGVRPLGRPRAPERGAVPPRRVRDPLGRGA